MLQSRAPKIDVEEQKYGYARHTPVEGRTDPFSQGVGRAAVIRLLEGSFTARDRRAYEKTEHFAGLKALAIRYYGSCVLCDRGRNVPPKEKEKALTIHHRTYTTLWSESVTQDITLLCTRCHGSHHRRRRK